jgi:hypothetical protein
VLISNIRTENIELFFTVTERFVFENVVYLIENGEWRVENAKNEYPIKFRVILALGF